MSLVVVAGIGSAGCSAPVVDEAVDANGAVTQGILVVERAAPLEGATPQTNVSAKFMRLPAGADPDLAERVVGSPFDLPASDGCLVVPPFGAEDAAPLLSALGPIELLDVGDVTVKARGAAMPLAARAFPDVGDLVFGVFYTSWDAASELPAPASYAFESSGSGLVDRFTIEADAPAGPEDVRVDGAELEGGVELAEGAGAVVEWRPGEDRAPLGAEDLVYVDVTAASGSAVRCAFPDTGRGVVPGDYLLASTLGALPASATVAVHRVRSVPFATAGMDHGEVRFDLSVIGRATVASR